jgi:hypothetical protein
MTTLIIGGDHIEKIRRELAEYGLHKVEHWPGRKPADARKAIPDRIRLVVAVTDQLSHSMLYSTTLKAARLDLPIIYSRRSGHELREKLEERYGKRPTSALSKGVSSGWILPFSNIVISY